MSARLVIVAIVCLGAVRPLLASGPDHLVPPYEDRDWGVHGYASFLEKKLFLTQATYGRILVLPSAGSIGEYSLSIYPSPEAGGVTVTCVRASRNVWSYLSDHSHGGSPAPARQGWEAAPLRFHRSDAILPPSTGAALRAALAAMLRGTRGRYPGTTRVIVDGTDIQFSLRAGGKNMSGVITSGLSGRNVSELAKLVESLSIYCQIQPPRQASLAREIEQKARQIATRANET